MPCRDGDVMHPFCMMVPLFSPQTDQCTLRTRSTADRDVLHFRGCLDPLLADYLVLTR